MEITYYLLEKDLKRLLPKKKKKKQNQNKNLHTARKTERPKEFFCYLLWQISKYISLGRIKTLEL